MLSRTLRARYSVVSLKELFRKAEIATVESLIAEKNNISILHFILKHSWDTVKEFVRYLTNPIQNADYFDGFEYIRFTYLDVLQALLKDNAISPKEHLLLTKGLSLPNCFFVYGKEYEVADRIIDNFQYMTPYRSIITQLYMAGCITLSNRDKFLGRVAVLDRYLYITSGLCFKMPILSTCNIKLMTICEVEELVDRIYIANDTTK